MVERQMCGYCVIRLEGFDLFLCVVTASWHRGMSGTHDRLCPSWARSHLFVKASLIRSGTADKQIIDVYTHSYIGINVLQNLITHQTSL